MTDDELYGDLIRELDRLRDSGVDQKTAKAKLWGIVSGDERYLKILGDRWFEERFGQGDIVAIFR